MSLFTRKATLSLLRLFPLPPGKLAVGSPPPPVLEDRAEPARGHEQHLGLALEAAASLHAGPRPSTSSRYST